MRRLAIIAAVIAAAAVAAVTLAGTAHSSSGHYAVRAIFDDASFAVTGEDVRVAGANVGTITALGVTDDKRAAVTLSINDARFTPFYANAHCAIRPQSLIGEEYVDCTPGTSSHPRLHHIQHGPGAGDDLLPVVRTSSPIDTDIVQNLSTEPVRQSLSVIISELGTGLAARGSDLNAVIHRANPALANTDRVIRILDAQNHTLAHLAVSSDQVLGPLARERTALAGFITGANRTAVASAAQAQNISRTFQRFPAFLRQLRPLMSDLGALSDQGTPVMRELGQSAPALGQEFAALGPFARSARTAIIDLGQAAHEAQPSLVAAEPLAHRLTNVGRSVRPGAAAAARLLTSLDKTGGIEQLMRLLYRGTSAANGFDRLGHYVRAEPLTGPCTFFKRRPLSVCKATFTNGKAGPSSSSADVATGTSSAAATTASEGEDIVARALNAVSGQETESSVDGLLHYLTGAGQATR